MKTFKMLLPGVAILMMVNCVFAQTWTQTSAPSTNWESVASSADGNILVAVVNFSAFPPNPPYYSIFTSTNSGATWLPNGLTEFDNWNCIASSADGKKLVGTSYGSYVLLSTDSGTTWIPTLPPDGFWNAVACSSDGNHLVAVAQQNYINNGSIYTSSDSGTTWVGPYTELNACSSVACSTDGNILVAGIEDDTIHISTNSGASWFATDSPTGFVWSVACSADGSKIIAASCTGGPVYTSSDSGTTWLQTSLPNTNWVSVASSADGTKLAAVVSYVYANIPGLIYTSTNSGKTWTVADAPSTNWLSIAMSADGNKLVAVANGGGIWTSQTTPSPQLNFTVTNGSFKLSWIIPSTNFVMQQSSDLSSWSDVTNTPVLNLANLQNEMVLSPTGSSGFFRLTAP